MRRHAAAPGHAVKLPVSLYASAVKAAEAFGLANVGQYVEEAVSEKLQRDRARWKEYSFTEAHRRSVKERGPTPCARQFGLPESFDAQPPGFRR